MADFNTLRIDLIRRLSLCGAWDGKLYWYKDTIQLLKKMMQFVPPKTNADQIRSMTDEELANKMYDWFSDDCLSCPVLKDNCPVWETGNIRCYDAILEWLKQECES